MKRTTSTNANQLPEMRRFLENFSPERVFFEFPDDDPAAWPDEADRMARVFDEYGVVVIRNAFPEAAREAAAKRTCEMLDRFYGERLSEGERRQLQRGEITGINRLRAGKERAFGNLAFGYLFPMKRQTYEKLKLDCGEAPMDLNFVHHNVHLEVLQRTDMRKTLAALWALGRETNVSVDSCKHVPPSDRRDSSMTKFARTTEHADECGAPGLRRTQALLVDSGRMKLMATPGTHKPEFRRMVCERLQTAWDVRRGFKAVKDEPFQALLRKHAVAPPAGSLIVMKTGVFHMENLVRPTDPHMTAADLANDRVVRYVVGTSSLSALTLADRQRLALAAAHNVTPAPYCARSPDTPAPIRGTHVSGKSTRYPLTRHQTQADRRACADAVRRVNANDLDVDLFSDLTKELYGIGKGVESRTMWDAHFTEDQRNLARAILGILG